MGRKFKPTHLKLVTGTYRKCRANPAEPNPAPALPDAPPELSADAKAEWARIAPELYKLGLLTSLDRAALAAYCDSWGLFVRAERLLRKLGDDGADGLLTKTAKGEITQNQLLRIARQAAAAMVAFGNEFGLSPSSRVKVAASPPHGNDPAMKFFDRGGDA
jgi:P27 family predicted phage terminase small subunit